MHLDRLPNNLRSFFVQEFKKKGKKEGIVVPSGDPKTQLWKYQVCPPGGALRQRNFQSRSDPLDASAIC